jgi:hypothetical protein
VDRPPEVERRLFSVHDLAVYLSVSYAEARQYLVFGVIPSVKLPSPRSDGRVIRRLLCAREDVDAFIDLHRTRTDGDHGDRIGTVRRNMPINGCDSDRPRVHKSRAHLAIRATLTTDSPAMCDVSCDEASPIPESPVSGRDRRGRATV